ncbi:TerD family protein, partial [Kitasatospora sp. SC0581]|uniref:TerD family protein n=1 Tax=Kitasatospora sp. SC0581 TaxID=3394360 RepID=UPI003A89792F
MSARSLTKGANLPIGPTTVRAELRWTVGPGVPAVEVSALLLAAADRVRGEADEVCYDRPRHPSGAVHHRGRTGPGGERIELELPSVEPEVQRILVTACTRGGAFG